MNQPMPPIARALLVAAGVACEGIAIGTTAMSAKLWIDFASPWIFAVAGLFWIATGLWPWHRHVSMIGAVVTTTAPFYRLILTLVDGTQHRSTSQLNLLLRSATWSFATIVTGLLWVQCIVPLSIVASSRRSNRKEHGANGEA